MALSPAALEEPQGTPYRASLRDQTPAQGPKFSRVKPQFGPRKVGANHPHDSVLREFRGLIVTQTFSGHAKGASPRSYCSSLFCNRRSQRICTPLYAQAGLDRPCPSLDSGTGKDPQRQRRQMLRIDQ
uniref:Uncharacterized protein n=1 Tax=Phlegmariurus squarrosus TaxID=73615 RepID=H9M8C5_PHLSQ|nr:hypothetical protein HusqMp92 [Phlegmariurus squarrosus]AEV55832.1 hypothetical protein HusqMp92 [Phlegmariurus squarrosus]